VKVELGASIVICSVYGPRAEKSLGSSARFNDSGRVDVVTPKVAPFARPLDGSGTSAATLEADLLSLQRSVSEALLGAVRLDRYPKCTVSVHLLVMRAGGDEVEAAIAAACLAMVDASIEMYDLLCPCSVSLSGDLTVSACYSPLRDAFPFVRVRGRGQSEEVVEALAAVRAGSNEIRKSIESVVRDRVAARRSEAIN
jgi:ribonuclease PH